MDDFEEEFDSTSCSSSSESGGGSGESSCEGGESELNESQEELSVSSSHLLPSSSQSGPSSSSTTKRKRLSKRKGVGLRKKLRTHIESVEEFNPEARDAQSAELERIRRLKLQQSIGTDGMEPVETSQSTCKRDPGFIGGRAGERFTGDPGLIGGQEEVLALREEQVATQKRSSSPEILQVEKIDFSHTVASEAKGPSIDPIIIDSGSSDSDDASVNYQGQSLPRGVAHSGRVGGPGPGGQGVGQVLPPPQREMRGKYDVVVPRPDGRVLVNLGHLPNETDVFLAPQIARVAKAHQIGGIRFLYDNIIESLSRFPSSLGFGCILAHSMGLGKTMQVIAFMDIFLHYTPSRFILCVVPVNTLQNWVSEFDKWLPPADQVSSDTPSDVLSPRSFDVRVLSESAKNMNARLEVIEDWRQSGGVLLIGYELYRLLSLSVPSLGGNKMATKKKKSGAYLSLPSSSAATIDLDRNEKEMESLMAIQQALCNPGPDLVVCDEGHRIKNDYSNISQALKAIKTRRRIVMTGYPLQNNLTEYWCMVDFVRPKYLGTKQEFADLFERPITNGQCVDSNAKDVQLMRYRSHVLHSLLEGFVLRRGHEILRSTLPPKFEHVLFLRPSPVQAALYNHAIEQIRSGPGSTSAGPLKAFAMCSKIWNHPDIYHTEVTAQEARKDSPVPFEVGVSKQMSRNGGGESTMKLEWPTSSLPDYVPGQIKDGSKMVVLLELICHSVHLGEKMLIFSQSLATLSYIEKLLTQHQIPIPHSNSPGGTGMQFANSKWTKNRNFYRLDGSTNSFERDRLINNFNSASNMECWVFLLSTKAGCLGVNLVGANRVVVLDVSWNPCYDAQAVCRVYRYGQTKPSYIYRLVCDGTMERKMYDRQISKQGMSNRVVDELTPERHLTVNDIITLMTPLTNLPEPRDFSPHMKEYQFDPVLVELCKNSGHLMTKLPFKHESLLLDNRDERITEVEKHVALKSFQQDLRLLRGGTNPGTVGGGGVIGVGRGGGGGPYQGPQLQPRSQSVTRSEVKSEPQVVSHAPPEATPHGENVVICLDSSDDDDEEESASDLTPLSQVSLEDGRTLNAPRFLPGGHGMSPLVPPRAQVLLNRFLAAGSQRGGAGKAPQQTRPPGGTTPPPQSKSSHGNIAYTQLDGLAPFFSLQQEIHDLIKSEVDIDDLTPQGSPIMEPIPPEPEHVFHALEPTSQGISNLEPSSHDSPVLSSPPLLNVVSAGSTPANLPSQPFATPHSSVTKQLHLTPPSGKTSLSPSSDSDGLSSPDYSHRSRVQRRLSSFKPSSSVAPLPTTPIWKPGSDSTPHEGVGVVTQQSHRHLHTSIPLLQLSGPGDSPAGMSQESNVHSTKSSQDSSNGQCTFSIKSITPSPRIPLLSPVTARLLFLSTGTSLPSSPPEDVDKYFTLTNSVGVSPLTNPPAVAVSSNRYEESQSRLTPSTGVRLSTQECGTLRLQESGVPSIQGNGPLNTRENGLRESETKERTMEGTKQKLVAVRSRGGKEEETKKDAEKDRCLTSANEERSKVTSETLDEEEVIPMLCSPLPLVRPSSEAKSPGVSQAPSSLPAASKGSRNKSSTSSITANSCSQGTALISMNSSLSKTTISNTKSAMTQVQSTQPKLQVFQSHPLSLPPPRPSITTHQTKATVSLCKVSNAASLFPSLIATSSPCITTPTSQLMDVSSTQVMSSTPLPQKVKPETICTSSSSSSFPLIPQQAPPIQVPSSNSPRSLPPLQQATGTIQPFHTTMTPAYQVTNIIPNFSFSQSTLNSDSSLPRQTSFTCPQHTPPPGTMNKPSQSHSSTPHFDSTFPIKQQTPPTTSNPCTTAALHLGMPLPIKQQTPPTTSSPRTTAALHLGMPLPIKQQTPPTTSSPHTTAALHLGMPLPIKQQTPPTTSNPRTTAALHLGMPVASKMSQSSRTLSQTPPPYKQFSVESILATSSSLSSKPSLYSNRTSLQTTPTPIQATPFLADANTCLEMEFLTVEQQEKQRKEHPHDLPLWNQVTSSVAKATQGNAVSCADVSISEWFASYGPSLDFISSQAASSEHVQMNTIRSSTELIAPVIQQNSVTLSLSALLQDACTSSLTVNPCARNMSPIWSTMSARPCPSGYAGPARPCQSRYAGSLPASGHQAPTTPVSTRDSLITSSWEEEVSMLGRLSSSLPSGGASRQVSVPDASSASRQVQVSVPDASSGTRQVSVPDASSGSRQVSVPDASSASRQVSVPDASLGSRQVGLASRPMGMASLGLRQVGVPVVVPKVSALGQVTSSKFPSTRSSVSTLKQCNTSGMISMAPKIGETSASAFSRITATSGQPPCSACSGSTCLKPTGVTVATSAYLSSMPSRPASVAIVTTAGSGKQISSLSASSGHLTCPSGTAGQTIPLSRQLVSPLSSRLPGHDMMDSILRTSLPSDSRPNIATVTSRQQSTSPSLVSRVLPLEGNVALWKPSSCITSTTPIPKSTSSASSRRLVSKNLTAVHSQSCPSSTNKTHTPKGEAIFKFPVPSSEGYCPSFSSKNLTPKGEGASQSPMVKEILRSPVAKGSSSSDKTSVFQFPISMEDSWAVSNPQAKIVPLPSHLISSSRSYGSIGSPGLPHSSISLPPFSSNLISPPAPRAVCSPLPSPLSSPTISPSPYLASLLSSMQPPAVTASPLRSNSPPVTSSALRSAPVERMRRHSSSSSLGHVSPSGGGTSPLVRSQGTPYATAAASGHSQQLVSQHDKGRIRNGSVSCVSHATPTDALPSWLSVHPTLKEVLSTNVQGPQAPLIQQQQQQQQKMVHGFSEVPLPTTTSLTHLTPQTTNTHTKHLTQAPAIMPEAQTNTLMPTGQNVLERVPLPSNISSIVGSKLQNVTSVSIPYSHSSSRARSSSTPLSLSREAPNNSVKSVGGCISSIRNIQSASINSVSNGSINCAKNVSSVQNGNVNSISFRSGNMNSISGVNSVSSVQCVTNINSIDGVDYYDDSFLATELLSEEMNEVSNPLKLEDYHALQGHQITRHKSSSLTSQAPLSLPPPSLQQDSTSLPNVSTVKGTLAQHVSTNTADLQTLSVPQPSKLSDLSDLSTSHGNGLRTVSVSKQHNTLNDPEALHKNIPHKIKGCSRTQPVDKVKKKQSHVAQGRKPLQGVLPKLKGRVYPSQDSKASSLKRSASASSSRPNDIHVGSGVAMPKGKDVINDLPPTLSEQLQQVLDSAQEFIRLEQLRSQGNMASTSQQSEHLGNISLAVSQNVQEDGHPLPRLGEGSLYVSPNVLGNSSSKSQHISTNSLTLSKSSSQHYLGNSLPTSQQCCMVGNSVSPHLGSNSLPTSPNFEGNFSPLTSNLDANSSQSLGVSLSRTNSLPISQNCEINSFTRSQNLRNESLPVSHNLALSRTSSLPVSQNLTLSRSNSLPLAKNSKLNSLPVPLQDMGKNSLKEPSLPKKKMAVVVPYRKDSTTTLLSQQDSTTRSNSSNSKVNSLGSTSDMKAQFNVPSAWKSPDQYATPLLPNTPTLNSSTSHSDVNCANSGPTIKTSTSSFTSTRAMPSHPQRATPSGFKLQQNEAPSYTMAGQSLQANYPAPVKSVQTPPHRKLLLSPSPKHSAGMSPYKQQPTSQAAMLSPPSQPSVVRSTANASQEVMLSQSVVRSRYQQPTAQATMLSPPSQPSVVRPPYQQQQQLRANVSQAAMLSPLSVVRPPYQQQPTANANQAAMLSPPSVVRPPYQQQPTGNASQAAMLSPPSQQSVVRSPYQQQPTANASQTAMLSPPSQQSVVRSPYQQQPPANANQAAMLSPPSQQSVMRSPYQQQPTPSQAAMLNPPSQPSVVRPPCQQQPTANASRTAMLSPPLPQDIVKSPYQQPPSVTIAHATRSSPPQQPCVMKSPSHQHPLPTCRAAMSSPPNNQARVVNHSHSAMMSPPHHQTVLGSPSQQPSLLTVSSKQSTPPCHQQTSVAMASLPSLPSILNRPNQQPSADMATPTYSASLNQQPAVTMGKPTTKSPLYQQPPMTMVSPSAQLMLSPPLHQSRSSPSRQQSNLSGSSYHQQLSVSTARSPTLSPLLSPPHQPPISMEILPTRSSGPTIHVPNSPCRTQPRTMTTSAVPCLSLNPVLTSLQQQQQQQLLPPITTFSRATTESSPWQSNLSLSSGHQQTSMNIASVLVPSSQSPVVSPYHQSPSNRPAISKAVPNRQSISSPSLQQPGQPCYQPSSVALSSASTRSHLLSMLNSPSHQSSIQNSSSQQSFLTKKSAPHQITIPAATSFSRHQQSPVLVQNSPTTTASPPQHQQSHVTMVSPPQSRQALGNPRQQQVAPEPLATMYHQQPPINRSASKKTGHGQMSLQDFPVHHDVAGKPSFVGTYSLCSSKVQNGAEGKVQNGTEGKSRDEGNWSDLYSVPRIEQNLGSIPRVEQSLHSIPRRIGQNSVETAGMVRGKISTSILDGTKTRVNNGIGTQQPYYPLVGGANASAISPWE